MQTVATLLIFAALVLLSAGAGAAFHVLDRRALDPLKRKMTAPIQPPLDARDQALLRELAALAVRFPIDSRWNQHRTGGPYVIMGHAKLLLTNGELRDGDLCVLYRRSGLRNTVTFVRPVTVFEKSFSIAGDA